MYKLFTYNIIAFIITLLIITVAILFSPKSFEAEKVSAYECGFEPFNDSRGTYNTHFYVIAILFIIFDLEIAYLFP
jgi:NADH-quinone oxidoreductase subunit A